MYVEKNGNFKPLLSGLRHLFNSRPNESSPIVPPLSNSLALFQEYNGGKYNLRSKLTTDCGPVMLLLSCIYFKIK